MEDYTAKMAGKTDAELRLYLERRAEYRDDAVLAALTELQRRGHDVPDAPALRAELETAIQQAVPVTVAAPPWARPAEEVEEEEETPADAPPLYSPSTVAVLSIVLSYPVGAVLMLLNMLKLRRYGGAALIIALGMILMSAQLWLLFGLKLNPNLVGLGCNSVGALLYVFVLWPNFIGSVVYQPRSWLPPLLITFALATLLVMLIQSMGVSIPALQE